MFRGRLPIWQRIRLSVGFWTMNVTESGRFAQASISRVGDAPVEVIRCAGVEVSSIDYSPIPTSTSQRPGIRFDCDSPGRVLKVFPSHNGSNSTGFDLNSPILEPC